MRSTTLLLLAGMVLLSVLLLMPLPAMSREMKALGDLLHFGLFALLTVALLYWAPPRATRHTTARTVLLLAIVVAFAYGSEKLQALSGREPSRHDFLADLCGAAAAALLALRRRLCGIQRLALVGASAGLFAVASYYPLGVIFDSWAARRDMPLLASFEQPWQETRWRGDFARCQRELGHATQGRYALRVELLPGRYSAITLSPPDGDWHGYHEVLWDVELLGEKPLDIAVKIYDQPHTQSDYPATDRFEGRQQLQPGMNHLRLSLNDVRQAPRGRNMQLDQIACFQLFTWDLRAPRVVYLDNLRLVR